MGAQHTGLKYGPAGAVRRERSGPNQRDHREELARQEEVALAAFRSLISKDKITHRAASRMIEEAAKNTYGRYALVTGWSGKVGTP